MVRHDASRACGCQGWEQDFDRRGVCLSAWIQTRARQRMRRNCSALSASGAQTDACNAIANKRSVSEWMQPT
eukprot:3596052-Rhodomonas_salina.2